MAYDNHGVSKTFYDSAAVGLKKALEKINFQARLLNQPKPTHHGGPPSLTRARQQLPDNGSKAALRWQASASDAPKAQCAARGAVP